MLTPSSDFLQLGLRIQADKLSSGQRSERLLPGKPDKPKAKMSQSVAIIKCCTTNLCKTGGLK